MSQQTAIEWLFQKLWDEPKDKLTWYALREKAIQMEKEQTKEISDEEIYDKAKFHDGSDYSIGQHHGFVEGAKWYREQLKKK